jgi:predicted ATPase
MPEKRGHKGDKTQAFKMKKYALIGGPCAGKSTVLDKLAKRGFYVTREAATHVIKQELAKDIPESEKLLPWTKFEDFQKKVLELQIQWETEIPKTIEKAFIETGIPSGIAYYLEKKVDIPEQLILESKKTNYEKVFFFEMLKEYKQTDIRTQPKEKAIPLVPLVMNSYELSGYSYDNGKMIFVRDMNVEKRVDFILSHLN